MDVQAETRQLCTIIRHQLVTPRNVCLLFKRWYVTQMKKIASLGRRKITTTAAPHLHLLRLVAFASVCLCTSLVIVPEPVLAQISTNAQGRPNQAVPAVSGNGVLGSGTNPTDPRAVPPLPPRFRSLPSSPQPSAVQSSSRPQASLPSYRSFVEQNVLNNADPNVPTTGARASSLPPLQISNPAYLNFAASQSDLLNDGSDNLTQDSQANSLLGESILGSGDDLLGGMGSADGFDTSLNGMGPASGGIIPGAGHGADEPLRTGLAEGEDPHASLYVDNCYPSAAACAKCHQKIYDEWRVSAHAYAAISPMFHKFEQAISAMSQGTIGTFCVRCHAPVATQLNYARSESIIDAPYVFREGVTCVACHRVKEAYGRVHGERRIEPGGLQDPVYGGIGGLGVAEAIAKKDEYKIKVDPDDKSPGQQIHLQGIKFEQLSKSGFCTACHQVNVHPGIGLEVVWAQYRAGPACKKGISCQDCHMGAVPGKALGYTYGAAANMSGKVLNENRRHGNHMFWGPINSIAHPGLFPHNDKALRWSDDAWLSFDWRSEWGKDEFEKALANRQIAASFPPQWDSADERRDARKVLDENLQLLRIKRESSIATMEAGSHVDGPFFDRKVQANRDLKFHYIVRNQSEGHNMPSGSLGAQPQLWLNVVLTGPTGQRLWESGYLDSNGDLANRHSLDVTQRRIKPDLQLFNLQTQFLITGVKGPDREMYLPVNTDFDQLAFLRPGNIPFSVLNHPPFIRMEAHSVPPLGHKVAKYKVPGELLCQPGTYRLSVRLRSRMEPIYFMKLCNATPEMERRMIENTLDLHPYTVEFEVR